MDIRLYNTLTRRVEAFEPVEPGRVRMYHCGPTVYDFVHIGNFSTFLLADLLRRFFEYVGYDVAQVMNITDVGHMTEDQLADGGGQDKMELAAERLRESKKHGKADVDDPNDPYQVAAYFTQAFLADAKLLGMKLGEREEQHHLPRATDNVPGMIRMIERLIEAGHAYVTDDGAVYYDVTSFPEYGKLSGNTLESVQAGAGGRIDQANQAGKRHPADFLLWKHDPRHIMKWGSPWGEGYPGWHIECSVMAMDTHGVETIDIHTGGEDNIFPHHECEIAQSVGATGKPFARYWLHNRHLLVEGEKMSKSKGNFYTLRDLLAKGVEPKVLRYELLRTHYRQNSNFTMKGLADSEKAVRRMRQFAAAADVTVDHNDPRMGASPVERQFAEALADDLNISAALGALFGWMNTISDPTADDVAALRRMDAILNVIDEADGDVALPTPADAAGMADAQVEQKVRQLNDARAQKDFALSDAIRDELKQAGVEVQISREGATWRRTMSL